jgi:hypothetical protein
MILLTSHNSEKPQKPFAIGKQADTRAGMTNCSERTREYAKKQAEDAPANTRSDPADRVRRFRENISWSIAEDRDKVRVSSPYLQSARFLIQCVLAPLYGESVAVQSMAVKELNKDASLPGRAMFIKSVLNALYNNKNAAEVQCLRNRAGNLIGLVSMNGPVPVVENTFELPELVFGEAASIEELIKNLKEDERMGSQNLRMLKYWLLKSTQKDSNKLYEHLLEILEAEGIDDKLESGFAEFKASFVDGGSTQFLSFKEHSNAILYDRITVFPIVDKKHAFGFDRACEPPLFFEVGDDPYVFLPPFTNEAMEASKNPGFSIESVRIVEEKPGEPSVVLDAGKLVSVTLRCVIRHNAFWQKVRKTYTNEQIRFAKAFPALSIYGPAPMRGWITRRDTDFGNYATPLKSGSTELFDSKDIEFAGIETSFEDTGEGYTVYHGDIPQWLGVYVKDGDWLGSIPLRNISKEAESDWTAAPNFAHMEYPASSGYLEVAADIGSSRSALLFHRRGEPEASATNIFIDKDQPLGITVTSSSEDKVDTKFGIDFFQPAKQQDAVRGKSPVGILATNYFERLDKTEALLYRSGKLILLDTKSISDASSRKILSDIKVGSEKDPKPMYLLAEGMLAMILDRAFHLSCSEVEIRLSYLIERYSAFSAAWKHALEKLDVIYPGIAEKVKIKMFLPESLAIVNHLKHEGVLTATSGAIIVDIGDFTSDFALLVKDGNDLKLQETLSVQFAGRQIVVLPIWDFLLFSNTPVKNLFTVDPKETDGQKALQRIEEARKKADKKKHGKVPEDVRRDILCLMTRFNRDAIPPALQNLFDICYLTEVVLIKRLLSALPKSEDGAVDIHLFGGGSFLIPDKEHGFDWVKVLGRNCKTQNRSGESDTLARGLLAPIHEHLAIAVDDAKNEAEKYVSDNDADRKSGECSLSSDELKGAYIRFLKNAQVLKTWKVTDRNDINVKPGKLFNVKKNPNDPYGWIEDQNLYSGLYDEALEYATAGSVHNPEIIKSLFAYKMAYSSAVTFYSKGVQG